MINYISKLVLFLLILFFPGNALATIDPFSVPNNKFGIHIISASFDEASEASKLVNSNGDWGYVTVLIESKDRNTNKWNQFFDNLRKLHLIPLVRLATEPEGDFWKRPYEGEEQAWADFLDNLNWPTKNRYVIIYNEPNHAAEWGNAVDAILYAQTLDKTITALKSKNRDFFVLNAGFDASAPSQPPRYEDELFFLRQMNEAVPGIFNKLDGWVSHSYPNPGFVGSPTAIGRGTVNTWAWELQKLAQLGVTKTLPVFITETGWKHAEGLKYESYLPSADTVSDYYRTGFENVWNDNRIVAVTPFLLNYQEDPFDHFSFRKTNSLDYYPQYQSLFQMPKVFGQPIQENKAQLTKGEIFSSVVAGETYEVYLTLKNTGQSIWNERDMVKLVPIQGGTGLGIIPVEIPKDQKIEPGQSFTFNLKIKAPTSGTFKIKLNLYSGDKVFDSPNLEFTTKVKAPVILRIIAALKWKKNYSGDYLLSISGPTGETTKQIKLDENGASSPLEARYLLPDYAFDFTLEKAGLYKEASIRQTLQPGLNTLEFGTLDPILLKNILHPLTFWGLLPFSN